MAQTIFFENISPSVRASSVFIELAGVRRSMASLYIPPTVGLVGQYSAGKTLTDYEPIRVVSADKVGELAGFGSLAHRQAKAFPPEVFLQGGGVWFFPVPEAVGAAAENTITVTGTATGNGTLYFSVGGEMVNVNVLKTETATAIGTKIAAAITAARDIAVTAANVAGVVTLTAKFKGLVGNELRLVQNPAGDTQSDLAPAGVTIALGSEWFADGAGEPALDNVFFETDRKDKLGDRFYTIFAVPYNSSTALDVLDEAFALRISPEIHRLCGSVVGYVNKTYSQALALPAAINSKFIAPIWDSRCLAPSFELAAALVGRVAYEQNIAPERPYKNTLVGLPFAIGNGLTYGQKDALFRAGMGWCYMSANGDAYFGDTALSYRTTSLGVSSEEWFDLEALSLRQAKVYSLEHVFNVSPYTRGVVVDNASLTSKPWAIKPKMVVADIWKLIDDLWEPQGWSKNIADVKKSVAAEINAANQSRIDATVTDDEAKVLRIIALRYAFLV